MSHYTLARHLPNRLQKKKSDGEPAIVSLQDAVKNSRQCDAILDTSPKGDCQSNREAENGVREAEGLIRTWKMYVEEKLKAVATRPTD